MEIGGVSFCVDQGCETFFQQDRISEWLDVGWSHVVPMSSPLPKKWTSCSEDLALVCPLAGEFFNLGHINTRQS